MQLSIAIHVLALSVLVKAEKTRKIINLKGETTNVGTVEDTNALYGTNVVVTDAFPSSSDNFMACLSTDIFDFITEEKVGTGTDCLWGLEGGNLQALTWFQFDADQSVIVHYGLTSVVPTTVPSGPVVDSDSSSPNAAAMTGALPEQQNILLGTNSFDGVAGTVRLSGVVATEPNVWMNCIWEMDMEVASPPTDVEPSRNDGGVRRKLEGEENRRVVAFVGESEALVNGVDEANTMSGLNVDEATLFPGVTRIDNLGCHKIDMLDFGTKDVIGTGIDCLWSIETGLAALTYFVWENGSIASAALTSTGPFTEGVGNGPVVLSNAESPDAMLVTGSVPFVGDNTFVATSGDFASAEGNVRLSGAAAPIDSLWLNCIWDIKMSAMPTSNAASFALAPVAIATVGAWWLVV